MATIKLYASKINSMPGLIKDVKSKVTDYKSELANLKNKTLQVNKSICNLDEAISAISTSTQTQDTKVASLETFQNNSEQFITETERIDNEVAEIVNQRKDDFYNKYNYLKPESEKNGWEKICDGVKSVSEWCKDNWKSIVKIVAAVLIVVALGIATVLTGGTLAVILAGAFWGALIGGAFGGIIGGITSVISGGSFLEGFADGAFSGALTGALFGGIGGVGQVLGSSCKVLSFLGSTAKAIPIVSKIFGGISLGMAGFDLLAFGIGLFNPDNFLVKLNQDLHSNKLYNGIQIGVSVLAVFSGGFTQGMKNPTCFVAGTMILTANGLVAIENIRAGDIVISTNPDTMETAEKRVVETYVRTDTKLIHLVVNGEEIITTETHPFYVNKRGFINAGELKVGDELLDVNNNILLIENYTVEITAEPTTVYNFQVEDFHTYFVGERCIWVHNASETYNQLRKVSPDAKAREAVNSGEGKKVDPVYGYEVDKLEADHIMPLKEITEQPGFDKLSFEDQKAVANLSENFMGLGKPTNASKGAKPVSEWTGHSKLGPIPEQAQAQLNRLDQIAREAIKNAISERLNK